MLRGNELNLSLMFSLGMSDYKPYCNVLKKEDELI